MGRATTALAGALAALAFTAGPASAGIWTPLSSGTTADITAVEYQSPTRFWFATSAGGIFTWNGSSFVQRQANTGLAFNDIAFQPGGAIGLAVGAGGRVYRSTDSGVSWTQVNMNTTFTTNVFENDCTTVAAPGTFDSVRWESSTVAWILGTGSQIAKSTNSGANWSDANDNGATCKISQDIDDVFVPALATEFFTAKSFGAMYLSTNGLVTPASHLAAEAGNGFEQRRRLAGDAGNPSRQWAVAPGVSGSYQALTQDSWSSAQSWNFIDSDHVDTDSPLYDIAFAGGTVLSAGDGGRVVHSTDGLDFGTDPGDGAQQTAAWRAVDLFDGAHGVIAGRNGQIAVTDRANVITLPPPPPATTPTPTSSTPAPIVNTSPPVVRLPAATFSFSGSGKGLTAKKSKGKRVTITLRGSIHLPRGVSKSRGCRGTVKLRARRGRKTVGTKHAKVKTNCKFTVRLRVKRSKLSRRARNVTVVLSLSGNRFVTVRSQTLSVPIR